MQGPRKVVDDAFISLVERIARENPDVVYNPNGSSATCSYDTTMRPDGFERRCLIGEALAQLGADEVWLSLQNGESAFPVLRQLEYSKHVQTWALFVQRAQDGGMNWAQAVSIANIYRNSHT